ncbi:MAG: class I SAM-dependent methyltransferase [Desulfovibrionaceae bacterium]
MKDTSDYALNQENWYASSQGSFTLMREKSLLQRALSPWPRRGHSLLDVQCGTGIFLDFFWEGGFDVSGIDSHQVFVSLAAERLNGKADVQVGVPDYLPFPDNEFDYVTLLHVLERAQSAPPILAEALRVAAKGVVIAFLNPWSVAAWGDRIACCLRRKTRAAPWAAHKHISPLEYYRMVRACPCKASISLRSTLFGPQWTWSQRFSVVNTLTLPLPFGTLGIVRIDLAPLHVGTPLPLRLQNVSFKNLTPVRIMERSRKDPS